jgi:hypothetical protein
MFDKISVLIPWRGGDPHRERVWNYIRGLWEELPVELCVGVDDEGGPFNCSRALNRAFKMSTQPYIMQFGADCFPSVEAMSDALGMLMMNTPWVPLFEKTEYYGESATRKILNGDSPDRFKYDPSLSVPFQTGVLAMTREAFIETGGSDERFEGWGAEDSAFRMALYRLYEHGTPLPHTLRCLWHSTGHRELGEANLALCQEYERIDNREDMLAHIQQRGSYV